MTAPNNAPVVSSIPYFGPAYLIGQTTNEYQPSKITSWNVVIPSPLVGNEAKAGFAAFSSDGVTAICGFSGETLAANFIGVFGQYYYQEGDVGTDPYNTTFPSNFQVPVVSIGSIYVYNGTAISITPTTVLNIVVTSTNPAAPVGAFVQGTPSSTTVIPCDSRFKVRSAQSVVGAGFQLDLLAV